MNSRPLLGQILLQLGTSADAVASTLGDKGIQGVRNTTRYLNPIVRFVQAQLQLDDYQLGVICGDRMPQYILRIVLADGTQHPPKFKPGNKSN